jgi:hypothetical protein
VGEFRGKTAGESQQPNQPTGTFNWQEGLRIGERGEGRRGWHFEMARVKRKGDARCRRHMEKVKNKGEGRREGRKGPSAENWHPQHAAAAADGAKCQWKRSPQIVGANEGIGNGKWHWMGHGMDLWGGGQNYDVGIRSTLPSFGLSWIIHGF